MAFLEMTISSRPKFALEELAFSECTGGFVSKLALQTCGSEELP